MDSANSHQRLLAVGDYLFMRRSCLQLVTTFSLFSLLISVSWVTSGTIAKSYVYIKFNPFFSSFFTHTLERKYMFLVFYGILAFLATSSSSASSSTSTTNSNSTRSNISSESSASYAHHHEEEEEELVVEGSAAVDDCDEIDDDSDVEECDQDAHNQVASEEKVKVQDGDCNTQIQHQGVEVEEVEEEEEEEEEGSELEGEGGNGEENGCSTEEMNSRFDELIRKMKVRMMSESKQQKLLQQLIDSVQLL